MPVKFPHNPLDPLCTFSRCGSLLPSSGPLRTPVCLHALCANYQKWRASICLGDMVWGGNAASGA